MSKDKPTIHEIAKELGISSATVSRALNNKEASKSTRDKVLKMVKKMGYEPNVVAASLRKGHVNAVGIIVPFIDRYLFSSIIRSVEEEVKKEGYNVIISQSLEKLENEREDIKTLLSSQVAGILISPSIETINADHLQSVIDSGKTLVMFDRILKDVAASSVSIDDFSGAYEMVSHLIKQGKKRIGFLSGNQQVSVFQDRQRGYLAAIKEHGLPSVDELLVDAWGFRKNGAIAAEKLMSLETPPDAIVSSSDFSALGAMQWLLKNGYRIPEDVSIAGFGNDPLTDYLTPTMSSVDQRSTQMGKAVAQLFLEEIKSKSAEKKRIILTPKVIIRKSTTNSQEVIQ